MLPGIEGAVVTSTLVDGDGLVIIFDNGALLEVSGEWKYTVTNPNPPEFGKPGRFS